MIDLLCAALMVMIGPALAEDVLADARTVEAVETENAENAVEVAGEAGAVESVSECNDTESAVKTVEEVVVITEAVGEGGG